MDYETAKQSLEDQADRKLSELGEAVDVLYQKHGNYSAIATQVGVSKGRLSDLRHVFLLPDGIRWQVDEGRIRIAHAYQISRLQGDDQWLLAFTVVEEKISVKESKGVVDAVVKNSQRLQDVLETRIGIRFDKATPLMIGLSFEEQFRISRASWRKKMGWADFSHRAIQQATRVDPEQIASELEKLADRLRPLGEMP